MWGLSTRSIDIDRCVLGQASRAPEPVTFFAPMSGKRVFIAGLGDSGVLTAIKLARHADVVGISAKPALVSGPELGSRLTGPDLLAPEPIDTAKTIGLMGTTAACDLTSRPTLRELRGLVLMRRCMTAAHSTAQLSLPHSGSVQIGTSRTAGAPGTLPPFYHSV